MMAAHIVHRALLTLLAAAAILVALPSRAEAQLGNLISPGKLARAHASLEGLSNCQKCHEQGRKVTPQKCLTCHEPVAQRIAERRGVHRDVKGDCVSCHVEHAGVDGELRPFDVRRFDHAGVAGYPLDGRHARIAGDCKSCHKGRSFLEASTSCATCHTDVHKGNLSKDCAACHTTQVPFKEPNRFDHAKSAFPLVGAHKTASCESCHVNKVYKGVKFGTCTDCHREPHRPSLGQTCQSCHSMDAWRTKKIDHARTAFRLTGKHADVACVDCHTQPAMKVKPPSATCGACHEDVHRGTFKEDCKACHSDKGFANTPFDHASTTFALTGKHEPLKCVACHEAVTPAVPDFRGLKQKTSCVGCHTDVHDTTLGTECTSCHNTGGFTVRDYVHKQPGDFFAGEHAPLTCDKCHTSRPAPVKSVTVAATHVTFTDASKTCATCHTDVHLGQVGTDCATCHSIGTAKFALAGFSHDATKYQLTGKHATVACKDCHKRESGAFPSGAGEAMRLTGLKTECQTCHADPHAGQISQTCDTCHSTASFLVSRFVHVAKRATQGFFVGRHAAARCEQCHPRVTAQFPAGRATAVRYAVSAECVTCHTDVHRGRLGRNCIDCHKP